MSSRRQRSTSSGYCFRCHQTAVLPSGSRRAPASPRKPSSRGLSRGVSQAEIDQARRNAHSDSQFSDYQAVEHALPEGASLFVAGVLGERDEKSGLYRVGPTPGSKRVVLFLGTQSKLVERRSGSSRGLRIAGYIVLTLGALPAVIFAIKRLSVDAARTAHS